MSELNNYEEATIEHIQDTLSEIDNKKDFELAMLEIERTTKSALSGISNKKYFKPKFLNRKTPKEN